MLKAFLFDYMEYFPFVGDEESESEEDEEGQQLMTVNSRIESEWQNARLPAYSQSREKEEEWKSKHDEQSFGNSLEKSRSDPNSWQVGFGRCPKFSASELIYGKGILTAKFLDLLTQQKSPTELKIPDEDGFKRLYYELSLELISGKLLGSNDTFT